MCGIIGINERSQHIIDCAAETIAHRGPDAYGSWVDENISLAQKRLSIIDLDPRATQPLWDDAHEVAVVYNGEIYNFQEIKRDLEQEYRFRTTSDTEVLIYGYKKYGPAFVEKLRGMFAFALYDLPAKRAFLFRDHIGIKPLYYYSDGGTFIFASETKAVLRALSLKGIRPTIETDAVRAFYGLGYVPSPRTIYANVRKLPRGTFLEFDLSQRTIVRIETFASPSATPRTESELFSLIEKCTLDHLVADVPVGVFFSGGTDSSLIASILHAHHIDLETFSIAVSGRDGDRPYFDAIAKKLGLHSHVYEFGIEEFNQVYDQVMEKTDEPNADISIFPTYYVSQKAAQHVTVVLSGEGGDELFFGYRRQAILAKMRKSSQSARLTILEHIFLASPTFTGKNYVFEKLFAIFRQPVAAFLLFMSPSRDLTTKGAWESGKRAITAAATDPLYYDRDLYLENDLLRKGDIATMLNSIEGRVPFLDPLIMSAARNFEPAFDPAGESKPILKRMLSTYIPHELVYRPKSGFGMSLPKMLPHSPALSRDLDDAIAFLTERSLLFAQLPKTREELVRRYPNLCFAMISLYRTIKNNEASLTPPTKR